MMQRRIAIFTTASLPWMTGTAVNPLFRAAYLAKDELHLVTLVIPWLTLDHQMLVYPSSITFSSPSDQETYIRAWLSDRIPHSPNFTIRFYPALFSIEKRSIFPVGDISDVIDDKEADVAVLEEPEHLTWFHHGKRWKTKFRLAIGIIHTNYLEYARREKNGRIKSLALKQVNSWVVGIYCHKVIRLSGATQNYPQSIICNVHGVSPRFLKIGENRGFTKGAYYIGKMVWSKGYNELLKLLKDHQNELSGFEIDLYGSGEDSEAVREAAEKLQLAITVNPGRDHSDPLFHDYKVFVNPSTSDVVCTTTAEALAMGKIVICADHPSNEFFARFENCWKYKNSDEFVKLVKKALREEPAEMDDGSKHEISWEAATERFSEVAGLEKEREVMRTPVKNFAAMSFNLREQMDDASAYLHFVASGVEMARRAFGAVPKSLIPEEQQLAQLGMAVPARGLSFRR